MKKCNCAIGVAVALTALTLTPVMADTEITILAVELDDQAQKQYYADIAKSFEEANPGISVNLEYIANEAYKTKLPTLLQSDARPDAFYSWGGLTLSEQAEAGFTKDISTIVSEDLKASIPDGTLDAFRVDGKLVGLPLYVSDVLFWVNTRLTEKAGVDHKAIETWDDFLEAVKTLKAAEITPIIVGGQDKWPLHFYWSYLALRMGGGDALPMAVSGEGENFTSKPFVEAGEKFVELIELEPFQPGFMSANFDTAGTLFSNDEGAFHLMGGFTYPGIIKQAEEGAPLTDETLDVISFPTVEGGAGGDVTLGGVNGYVVTPGAPDETVAYLEYMLSIDNQRKGGASGFWLPIVEGSQDAIENPFFRKQADDVAAASHHQIYLDQYLGASVGATVNDISADLAAGATTPEEAAEQIQEAWDFR
ncbi:ABC transporter substrate-binding protein [Granulosicoccus sp. 3-233]|uniref:ABC transporter substrate-binding protein n=1 Tax=Granulosicoccus sp. 3-233 TaxID=3417969 RepID=UPI003D32B35E